MVVVLGFPATAAALPPDPPVTPVTPGDGAVVAVDSNGIEVTYSCPLYKIGEPGGFPQFGGAKDYGVSMSTSPDVDADGRLATFVALNTGTEDSTSHCVAAIGAGGPTPRIQETPGAYYWQVWRLCTGCENTNYEVGPIRTITLQSPVRPSLSVPSKTYGGYGFFASIAVEGAPDGTAVYVERRSGSSWKRVGSGTALGGKAEAVVSLAKGKHTLRASLMIGSQGISSDGRSLTVSTAKQWTTAKADGDYKGKVGSRSVTFKVAKQGKELRSFSAYVPMTCPGITAGQFTTQIGTAKFIKVKIAPDGSFGAASSPEQNTTMRLRGKLKGRKVTGGRVELSVGNCVGNAAFSASR